MLHYRIYCLNEEGRFSKVEEFEADRDADALDQARALKHSYDCEVWSGARLVGRIPAEHVVEH